jgi:alanine racemase
MDLTMVDVSAAGTVQVGDVALVVGESPQGWRELARLAGTIPYELICHLGKRLSRQYGRDR